MMSRKFDIYRITGAPVESRHTVISALVTFFGYWWPASSLRGYPDAVHVWRWVPAV